MWGRGFRREALCSGAAVAALILVYVGLSFAAPAHAVPPSAALTDTEPAPEPQPTPDPAPPPAPKPKPARKPVSKPSPAPVHRSPAPVSHARTPSSSPGPSPTYKPPVTRVAPRVHRKSARQRRKHARHRTHAAPAPKPLTSVTTAPVARVRIGAETASVTSADDHARRLLVTTGLALAAFFFLLVMTVSATGLRLTMAGRVVMDHQADLLIAGIATLLMMATVFLVTSGG